jgi:hypothetical protein
MESETGTRFPNFKLEDPYKDSKPAFTQVPKKSTRFNEPYIFFKFKPRLPMYKNDKRVKPFVSSNTSESPMFLRKRSDQRMFKQPLKVEDLYTHNTLGKKTFRSSKVFQPDRYLRSNAITRGLQVRFSEEKSKNNSTTRHVYSNVDCFCFNLLAYDIEAQSIERSFSYGCWNY